MRCNKDDDDVHSAHLIIQPSIFDRGMKKFSRVWHPANPQQPDIGSTTQGREQTVEEYFRLTMALHPDLTPSRFEAADSLQKDHFDAVTDEDLAFPWLYLIPDTYDSQGKLGIILIFIDKR